MVVLNRPICVCLAPFSLTNCLVSEKGRLYLLCRSRFNFQLVLFLVKGCCLMRIKGKRCLVALPRAAERSGWVELRVGAISLQLKIRMAKSSYHCDSGNYRFT
jgi:hypothetical protein